MDKQYIVIEEIDDPRLTPEMQRIRAGTAQHFRRKDNRSNIPDVILEPKEKHYFAELIDGKWHWVNGCDICSKVIERYGSYRRCVEHDVCHACGRKRADCWSIDKHTGLNVVWGHEKGFECVQCHDKFEAIRKAKAQARISDDYDSWDYENTDNPKCPWCDAEYTEPDHGFWEAEDDKEKCFDCDNYFIITANQTVNFTTERVKDG